MLSKVCFILDINLHGASIGRYQMVSVERTHLQMELMKAQQEEKASPLDPWVIKTSTVTTASQLQDSFPAVFCSKN